MVLFWLTSYLAVGLAVFFSTVYLFTRFDIGRYWDDENRTAVVVAIALLWPIVIPITLLVFVCMFLGELAVSAGEAARKR